MTKSGALTVAIDIVKESARGGYEGNLPSLLEALYSTISKLNAEANS